MVVHPEYIKRVFKGIQVGQLGGKAGGVIGQVDDTDGMSLVLQVGEITVQVFADIVGQLQLFIQYGLRQQCPGKGFGD